LNLPLHRCGCSFIFYYLLHSRFPAYIPQVREPFHLIASILPGYFPQPWSANIPMAFRKILPDPISSHNIPL
jgi:hypothetical protein